MTAATQAECRVRAEELVRKWRLRLPGAGTDTLADYLEGWLERQGERLRPRTVEQYGSTIRTIIVPALGSQRVSNITHRDVEAMMRAATRRGLSPRSANLARAVLGAAMKDAMRDGLIVTNPAALARPVPSRRPQVSPPTPAQVSRLLEAARESSRWPLYVVAVSLGLRQGELLGLSWKDVEGETVQVRHTLRKDAEGWHLDPPKTPTSVRVLPLTGDVAEALSVQRAILERDRKQAGKGWEKRYDRMGLVFRNRYGAPVNGIELTKALQRDLEAVELPKFRFHDLRHACATFLLARGVELRVISEILGHSSISTTASVYAHVSLDTMREALQRGTDSGTVFHVKHARWPESRVVAGLAEVAELADATDSKSPATAADRP